MTRYSRAFRVIVPGAAAILFARCSQLPAIIPADFSQKESINKICASPFSQKSWRFIHSIEAEMPDGSMANLLGVTVVKPSTRSIHCVLMTLEGLVVFEAAKDNGLKIKKALPPLDNPHFARGLMEDISLVYFPPSGICAELGSLDGAVVCRYKNEGALVDVKVGPEEEWEILSYDSSKRLNRVVHASDIDAGGVPRTIRLRAPGLLGYTLILTLIEKERVP